LVLFKPVRIFRRWIEELRTLSQAGEALNRARSSMEIARWDVHDDGGQRVVVADKSTGEEEFWNWPEFRP
jgi:hypothetical protein